MVKHSPEILANEEKSTTVLWTHFLHYLMKARRIAWPAMKALPPS